MKTSLVLGIAVIACLSSCRTSGVTPYQEFQTIDSQATRWFADIAEDDVTPPDVKAKLADIHTVYARQREYVAAAFASDSGDAGRAREYLDVLKEIWRAAAIAIAEESRALSLSYDL